MDLLRAINELPLWLSAMIACALGLLAVPLGHLAVRRRFGLETLLVNNEVAGFKYAVLGVVFAVLQAFLVVAVWEDFDAAEGWTRQEARALEDLGRIAPTFGDERAAALNGAVAAYAGSVITDEWPAMARGEASPATQAALDRLFAEVLAIDVAGGADVTLRDAALRLAIEVGDSRRLRLEGVEGSIPGVLWLALVVGATTTLGFTYFFGSANVRAQAAMTAMLGLTVVLVLYVSVLLDHPFSGEVSVSPEAFHALLGNAPHGDR